MLIGALLSFVFGGKSALCSAFAVGWLVWGNGTVSYRVVAVVASLVCAVFAVAKQSSLRWDFRLTESIATFIVLGMLSALICRWAMGRVGLLSAGVPEANKS